MPSTVAKTPGELKRAVQKMRTWKGSEGVMLKVSDSTYPVVTGKENRTPLWSKLKNLKEISVMVWNKVPKKGVEGQWEYDTVFLLPPEGKKHWRESDVVEYEGKTYAKIGRTFSTAVSCEKGDIIDVLVGRIRIYEREGKTFATWMFPKFKEKTDKKDPDTLDTVRKLSKVGPGFIEKLSDTLVLKLKPCEFGKDPSVCPLKLRFGMPRNQELSELQIEYLRFPVACPLAYLRKCLYCKSYYYGFKTWKRVPMERRNK
jgi:hypothetical protein